jgi:hypothetical protein
MDSPQAKRAIAISFQLRLRDRTQPVKKRQTRQVSVGFVGFSSLAPNHLSGEGGKVATSCIEIEVTIERLS